VGNTRGEYMSSNVGAFAALAACMFSSAVLADPTPGKTEVIGPFIGHDAQLHPDNATPKRIAFYGTDLGWTYVHQGKLHTPQLPPNDYGFLYSANLIGPWIKPVGKSVDVIWNASTCDPYRVVLLRTRIDP
jgi:hypothetical protein